MNDGSGLKYLLTDHLGSVAAVVSEAGSLISEQRYMPFGEVRTEVGTISQTDFGYTGQRSISMLSIMDYIARFYDPAIGRFLQPDTIVPSPADPQSWNRYSYGYNNPIKYIDPSGHDGIPWWEVIKYLGNQLLNNGGIADADWVNVANNYVPAVHKGSNFTAVASGGFSGGGVVLEANYVTTDDGEFQMFLTHGEGLASSQAGTGYTQGFIDGNFETTADFRGFAVQGSLGINTQYLVGATADGWLGLKEEDDGSIRRSGVYGGDVGVTIGSPGPSGSVVLSKAKPTSEIVRSLLTRKGLINSPLGRAYATYADNLTHFRLNGFGLFACRAISQCGRPLLR